VNDLSKPSLPGTPEAFSLFGDPLFPQPLRPEVLDKQKELYAKALSDWEKKPDDADAIIWLGRRTAYLGRIRDSIAIFSMGIDKHPEDPRMYRHRGHRFISLRLFEQAVDDLEKAGQLIEGKPDEIEPDGLPNERNQPTSSLHFNIWYHLGLAYYLVGDYESAYQAYQECLKVSKSPDKLVSTSHWTFMTLRTLDREDEAKQLLEPITEKMDIIENQHYHQLLLMYKSVISAEDLLEKTRAQGSLAIATIGYGIGNWYMNNGEEDKAKEVYEEILRTGGWAGFGYIAAEADLKWLCMSED